jgi:D-alanyl-lipoteichoic acid acyltransferase DltB (MBOAT superfamily)
VYIPLGGNRVAVPRQFVNILVVFILSGFWHGANWTFVLWGAVHALLYVVGRVTAPFRELCLNKTGLVRMPMAIDASRVLFTFICVCAAWVFFRAESVDHAIEIFTRSAQNWDQSQIRSGFEALYSASAMTQFAVAAVTAGITVMLLLEIGQEEGRSPRILHVPWKPIRWTAYASLILVILNSALIDETTFIYFQF